MSPLCCWCRTEVEDGVHILFNCCFAREVWNELGMQPVVTAMHNDTVMSIFKRFFQTGTKEQCVMLGLFCWSLWFRRNKWLWHKNQMSVFVIKAMALNMLVDWRKSVEEAQKQGPQLQQTVRVWCKPPPRWIQVNIDAACKPEEDFVKIGCVARDDNGKFLGARNPVVRRRASPREAEGLSLKEALIWAKPWRDRKFIFETDSKFLVDAVNGVRGRSYFDTIVADCSELLKHFGEVLLIFVPRSANRVAHLLAKAAGSMSGLQEWSVIAPEFIQCNLALEKL